MFTGIIETTGTVKEVIINGTNKTFWVDSPLSGEFKIDQSVSHSGVCLTVDELRNGAHRVTAIEETLSKTNLGGWQAGSVVNIERCLRLSDRLDGHFVQGHTDCTGSVKEVITKNGSWELTVNFPVAFAPLMIEKGSICMNGVSLTAFDVTKDSFRVAIIPYTYEHTNINAIERGSLVNLEFDMIGKYITRSLGLSSTQSLQQ